MKKVRFAPVIFMIAFCCAYGGVFALNSPLFLYYPLHGTFSWKPQAMAGAGPPIAWYGLMAKAAMVAVVAAFCIPEAVPDRTFRNYLWMFPVAAMATCVFLLRRLFA